MEGLVIPSDDGTPLEAWYIPAKGGESDKLIIFNPALPMCRAGFPGHFGEPWSNFDPVEIDFVIQYKHLTDAGYNMLTYDIRNHGNSSAANNGLSGHRPVGMARLRTAEQVEGLLCVLGIARPCILEHLDHEDGHRDARRPQVRRHLGRYEAAHLHELEGTTRRFKDGYNYFGRHPEKVLGFLDKHMK